MKHGQMAATFATHTLLESACFARRKSALSMSGTGVYRIDMNVLNPVLLVTPCAFCALLSRKEGEVSYGTI